MPVSVHVHFTGQLARAAGLKERVWTGADGVTLDDLVVAVARGHGEQFAALLLDAGGRPRPSTLRVVNGEQIPPDAGRLPLVDGAEVVLMTPIAGG